MLRAILLNLLFCLLFGINLNNIQAQSLEPWQVQGDGLSSPYLGQTVTLEGNIVIAKGSGFFFIQSPEDRSDNDPMTSDALLVAAAYFGGVGDVVDVTGLVAEEDGTTTIVNASVTGTGNSLPLPSPVMLTDEFPSPEPSPVHSLERVEGMRVQFVATANGPSSSFETVPLRIGEARVFREPGIRFPGLSGLPVWDGNPELFWFDPNGLGEPNNRFIATGSRVEATAVMIEAGIGFWLALADSYTVEAVTDATSVRPKESGEYTVGSLNLLRYFIDEPDFDTRTSKLVRYIGEQMRWPDILAVQEAGSLEALDALVDALEDRYPTVRYEAYLLPSNGSIKTGFLVRDYIQGVSVLQYRANQVFTFSGGLLHDRPPLLLRATLPTEPPQDIQVLNLHLRSLIGIEGDDGLAEFVRNKRHQQGISVAQIVEELRIDGNLVVMGDFNAFPYTDGYVDVFHQISGGNTLGALFPPLPITSSPLDNQLLSLPAEDRYSYVFQGSAQALDHCLTANFEGLQTNGMAYARGNADFPTAYSSNSNLALSSSDHDGLVLYVGPEGMVAASETSQANGLEINGPNPISAGEPLQLSSRKGALSQITIYDVVGRVVYQSQLSGRRVDLVWPELSAGGYVVVLEDNGGDRQQRVVVNRKM
jgi:endonuclease/exonuclease/phosphatase family metal-dependent hydrolase